MYAIRHILYNKLVTFIRINYTTFMLCCYNKATAQSVYVRDLNISYIDCELDTYTSWDHCLWIHYCVWSRLL